ncbi:MAG: intradiol ring-cleavage dioxygenase [Bacteroidota bacterium]
MASKQSLFFTSIFLIFLINSCLAQKSSPLVGGPCQGCEALHEYGSRILRAVDTLPAFEENEPKLHIQGKVYHKDGITPASEVILYIYHTNRSGMYEKKGDETGWAKRHGYIRGWIKTGSDGKYEFYSFRPAAYPDQREAEHIHMILKEPGKNEYYIENLFFEDDPLFISLNQKKRNPRGGSGIVKPVRKGRMLEVERDIILGLNIPNYK